MEAKTRMKQGRKTSNAYELYGFIPKFDLGKHSALCTSCNRVLQNTAATRLLKHRNSCLAARASGNAYLSPTIAKHRRREPQNRNEAALISQQEEQDQFENEVTTHNEVEIEEAVNSSVKLEQSNSVAENNCAEDSIDATTATTTDAAAAVPITTTQPRHARAYSEEEPQTSAVAATSARSFESYQFGATTATADIDPDLDFDSEDVSDLINIDEELDVIQNLMPRSKQSLQLQEELCKAETEYYNVKAIYFAKLTENTKVKRTLMILQSRKLQLEIEKLQNDS